jgi:hypothetical protein
VSARIRESVLPATNDAFDLFHELEASAQVSTLGINEFIPRSHPPVDADPVGEGQVARGDFKSRRCGKLFCYVPRPITAGYKSGFGQSSPEHIVE